MKIETVAVIEYFKVPVEGTNNKKELERLLDILRAAGYGMTNIDEEMKSVDKDNPADCAWELNSLIGSINGNLPEPYFTEWREHDLGETLEIKKIIYEGAEDKFDTLVEALCCVFEWEKEGVGGIIETYLKCKNREIELEIPAALERMGHFSLPEPEEVVSAMEDIISEYDEENSFCEE